MPESFQRIFTMSGAEALSLNAQAALGPVRVPKRSQFSLLVRHFLERFFSHETASSDGDAKSRMLLVALAAGVPGFVVAIYLWPDYHSFIPYLRNNHVIWTPGPPPYWAQVNQHFFFAMYSFVALGIATVFQWDLFFPDLLDLFVLKTLPIPDRRLFLARAASIAILIGGFLFDANVMASLVLPAAIDPPNLQRFLAGHILAVTGSGLFASLFILALQGVLLSVLGERLFRKLSLFIQGFAISALLMLLLLFPVLSGAVPVLLQSGNAYTLCFPPFWFLGIYQRLMEGPSAMPIYGKLAQIGSVALLVALVLAVVAYPLAYIRRTRQLVEGPGTHTKRNWIVLPLNKFLHVTIVRPPIRRAVFHFVGQSLMRVERYRIYLVIYGGLGLSAVVAAILRLTVVHRQIQAGISPDGIRSAIGIVTFWTIAGLRMAFVSPGNRQGSWVFHIVHGRPPQFHAAIDQLLAAKIWVLLCGLVITFGACFAFRVFAPAKLLTWPAMASQSLIAAGMCLLLTDAFFLRVKIVAFTGEPAREQPNLAASLLKYIAFVPVVASIPVIAGPWIEMRVEHFALAATAIAAAHLALRSWHRRMIHEHCNMPALEDGEEDFPMKLGLRY